MAEKIKLNGKEYELQKELGSGGQGTVYLAQEVGGVDRIVVKKFEFPKDCEERERKLILDGIEREAEQFKKYYADSPELAVLVKVNRFASPPYMTMPYFEGQELFKWFVDGERATRRAGHYAPHAPLEIMNVFSQWLGALERLERAGIVYVDIKSENFVFTRDGELRLVDFGAARSLREGEAAVSVKGGILGTRGYLPLAVDDTSDAAVFFRRTSATDREATAVCFVEELLQATYLYDDSLAGKRAVVSQDRGTGIFHGIREYRAALANSLLLHKERIADTLLCGLQDEEAKSAANKMIEGMASCVRHGLSGENKEQWEKAQKAIKELPGKMDNALTVLIKGQLQSLQARLDECAKSLAEESQRVYRTLGTGSSEDARAAVDLQCRFSDDQIKQFRAIEQEVSQCHF